jgi:hypothetical protein
VVVAEEFFGLRFLGWSSSLACGSWFVVFLVLCWSVPVLGGFGGLEYFLVFFVVFEYFLFLLSWS